MKARRIINETEKNRLPWFRTVLILGLFFLIAVTASAADVSTEFDSANRLYEQGKFSEAADAYDKLIQSGTVSSTLYFNLGNACFKSGQLGRAISAYRHVEKISPRDPDVRANIQFVRSRIQGTAFSPPRWQRWLTALTINEWATLAAVILWSWLGALIFIQFRPGLAQSLRNFLWLGGVATLLAGGCAGAALSTNSTKTAIVVAHDAMIHNGPLEESPTNATVHDGAELQLLDTNNEWVQVRLDNQRVGWLKREQVALVSGV